MKSVLHEEKFITYNRPNYPINSSFMSDNNVILNNVRILDCDNLLLNKVRDMNPGIKLPILYHCSLCGDSIFMVDFVSVNDIYKFHTECANFMINIKNQNIIAHIYLDYVRKEVYYHSQSNKIILYDGNAITIYVVERGYIRMTPNPQSLYRDLLISPNTTTFHITVCNMCLKTIYIGVSYKMTVCYCLKCYEMRTKFKKNLIQKRFILYDVMILDIVNNIMRAIIDILDILY